MIAFGYLDGLVLAIGTLRRFLFSDNGREVTMHVNGALFFLIVVQLAFLFCKQ